MIERDYTELEGKEIMFKGVPAIVAGCEKDIGITIVAKDGINHRLLCLRGPSFPGYSEEFFEDKKEMYEQLFNLYIEAIDSGEYTQETTKKAYEIEPPMEFNPTQELYMSLYGLPERGCAFSQ